MLWTVFREIVLEERAHEFIDQASAQNNRFEDQWRGVEWLLARTPEKGSPRRLENPSDFLIYVFPRNSLAGTNELWVLYSYKANQVIIHAVRFG